ncbi:MAG: SEC59/DGK1/VTE5 family protein [Ignavibacteria bacterium]|jgi:dolichol kinase|nr:SEC59/DGK1/VTE5 family protein [Ignavibacteria bacterium]
MNNENTDNTDEHKGGKLPLTTEQLIEQLIFFRNQVLNTRSIVQNKTQSAIENAKNQIIDVTKRIESDIKNIDSSVKVLEQELIASQQSVSDNNITFLQEILRKAIHFCSLSIPILYYFLDKEILMMLLVPIMLFMVAFDLATKRILFLRSAYLKLFGFMLRKHEIMANQILLNGASWVMISAVLTVYFFPQHIAIVALSILFISDIVAAIIGRKYGKKRFIGLKNKSWIGTMAFFVSAICVVGIWTCVFGFSIQFFLCGVVASAVAAVSEALATEVLRTDDNLAIPISFGIMMWVCEVFIKQFLSITLI